MRLSSWFRLGIFAAVLAVMGCAPHAQKQVRHIETQLKHAISQNEHCQAWLKQSDVYERLEKIFILNEDDSDKARKLLVERNAVESEKQDLVRLNNLAAVCRKNNLQNFGRVHPDFVALLAQWYAQDDELMLELLKDEISIGKANEIGANRMAERKTQSKDAGARISQQLETSHQAEPADRQRAAAAMRQWNYQQTLIWETQQMSNSTSIPTVTNCEYLGNSIRCTSF